MVRGVGSDIVKIMRISRLIESDFSGKFMARAFHPQEIAQAEKIRLSSKRFEYFASRWAAKEAIMKAMGERVLFPEILVLRSSKGRPSVFMEGRCKKIFERLELKTVHLTISHEKDVALAVAVVE